MHGPCLLSTRDVPLLQNRSAGIPLNTVEPEQQGSGWDCPTCRTHVLEERNVCFKCGTNRALAPSFAPPLQEEINKFRELGRSFLSEMEGKEKTPDVKDSGETPEAESKTDKKDQWSWDMSSLERLEEATETENMSQKTSKHRDSRKQRPTKDNDDFDVEEHQRRREERKKLLRKKAEKKKAKEAPAPLYLPEFISVSNLADVINVRPAQFVQRMEDMGFEDITYSHVLDAETAGLVVTEFNFEPIFETATDELEAAPVPEDTSVLPPRPPVVTIMGHVDHGKTTILDWLRKSSVAASEHGGITQHIGAFSVAMPSGKTITFLDTPGHSAFLEMRRRGADVTDIVVLVVAADDSVKPQTIEAIKHATQAKVPIIVAISKIDKEGRNPDRVKQDLAMHGVNVEDYGGDVQAIPVSGKTGQGMIDLEEAIVALSEMLDHRADIHGNVEGWVIETTTKTYGRVTSALIRRGTLRPGDVIVAGTTWARVRTLRNEAGVSVDEATPGMPVEIDGWREQPTAGTEMLQAPSEQKAKDVVAYRQERSETKKMGQDIVAINEARRDILEKRKAEAEAEESESEEPTSVPEEPTGPKAINFVVKADVDGSAEAVLNSIAAIGNNEVYANVIRSGVGPVAEFDIEHAASARGHIISFNMPIDASTMRMAELQGVNLMDHNIIYKLIDDVKDILSKHLPPSITKRVTGEAEVRQVFEVTLKGRAKTAIAGSRVRNGTMNRNRKVRVIRGDETIYDGKFSAHNPQPFFSSSLNRTDILLSAGTISSLKNVKKDVTEMRKDTECGIGFDDWADFSVGDHIQCYEEIFEKRYL
ncbi:hypothetical protein NUU61_009038 [Penicillium alfredii]|uniref:Translation initiation factor IF-2, mitochondrial n=1 Tax=Penicillium alfredii TaxID=1506179 RepID=A0A9W9EMK5_9EURO|nr:uncharacterized protein NUU61_009038 [Penicillium alfredii]KAJ5084459.1 hypothetical protein NUU61_009038 [Penicillium alfredii]